MSYFEFLAIVAAMPKTETHVKAGILAPANDAKRTEILALLERAYWMEMETVMSYVANSAALDGIRAEEIAEALDADVDEELGHARKFAARIKELYGTPPGSLAFTAEQASLQPPADATDVAGVIRGVIEAEAARSSTTRASSRPATASTGRRRTWSSTSCATRRATSARSSAICASSTDSPRGRISLGFAQGANPRGRSGFVC